MTLTQFVESKWFKLLSRGAMVLLFPAVVTLATFILALMNDVGAVQDFSAARARDSELFQAEVLGEVKDVRALAEAVRADISGLQIEFAKASGILEEMQRRDLAQVRERTSPTWGAVER